MIYNGEWQTRNYPKFTPEEYYSNTNSLAVIIDYQKIHLYCYIMQSKVDKLPKMYISQSRYITPQQYITLWGGQTNVKFKRYNMRGNIPAVKRIENLIYNIYLNDLCYYDNNLSGVDFERVLEEFV